MEQKLFTEFPPVSTQEWESVIVKDLKGADYDRKLMWRTQEGFSVRPFYRKEDTDKLSGLDRAPGEFPYMRGTGESNGWLIRQDFDATGDLGEANRSAVDALSKGAEAIGFDIGRERKMTIGDMKELLGGIDLKSTEINFTGCSPENASAVEAFLSFANEAEIPASDLEVSFDFSPLHDLVTAGTIKDEAFDRLAEILKGLEGYPGIDAICANGYDFNDAGASIVQETAFALACASYYIDALKGKPGMTAGLVASKIRFKFSVGSNYFMEIAKFRAARVLWAEISDKAGAVGDGRKMVADAVTSRWNQTLYDSYVNMLRNTTEAMSAAIGGVHSLTVIPFDSAYRKPDAFSNRIARNVQIILKEESHFDFVADPAGGSYYVEELTSSIKDAVEKLFNATCGGGADFRSGFEDGTIRREIEEVTAKRDAAIAKGREVFVGTNAFPNFEETELKNAPAVRKDQPTRPLRFYRGAEPFERLRLATEKSGRRPAVFMLTFGNLAMCRARAQFSGNFFATAGFKIMDNNRFDSIET
ncbi:MAG: methylmalonyl-CoA mutase subunit beta, partial [Bacteroidales bacterium]|nr:methylmalonyl-CoA mutase subunit beta [Bacteroidales bacterium]